jgi:hypothetical protein
LAILCYGRIVLPPLPDGCVVCHLAEGGITPAQGLGQGWKRFASASGHGAFYRAHLRSLSFPDGLGAFAAMERWLARISPFVLLTPQALSIVMFQVVAEFSAGLAAAGP